jgi:hypothetical protein
MMDLTVRRHTCNYCHVTVHAIYIQVAVGVAIDLDSRRLIDDGWWVLLHCSNAKIRKAREEA